MNAVNSPETSLEGKVAIVTGAGSGLGKFEAIGLAKAGASLVVNDLAPNEAVEATLEEIRGLGAKVEFVAGNVGERSTADALMEAAQGQFGSVDIVVNNAGVVRDRMLFNMSDEDWDLVLEVHLRGHFLLCRNAAAYWRAKSKEAGAPVYGRIVNTSSEAGLLGPEGQPNYGAAKAGITALTLSAARGLSRYGVRANAICPRARTSMTEGVFGDAPADASIRSRPSMWHRSSRTCITSGRRRQRSGIRGVRTDGCADGGARRRAEVRCRGRFLVAGNAVRSDG